MNLLLVGADQNNATDGMIVRGIRNLLHNALGSSTIDYLFLDDHNPMPEELLASGAYDAILVAGTPWLWHYFQNTPKFKNLLKLFSLHPQARRILFGIGSCVDLGRYNSTILRSTREREGMHLLTDGALTITRDPLAHGRLTENGLWSHLLACPAYWSVGKLPAGDRPTLIWTDPINTISQGYWKDNPDLLRQYYDTVRAFVQTYKPDVYTPMKYDLDTYKKIGSEEVRLLTGPDSTIEMVKKSSVVLSGRVHNAVPAISAGRPTGLIPFDSRSLVVSHVGGALVSSPSDFDKIKEVEYDFKADEAQYVALIRRHLLGE